MKAGNISFDGKTVVVTGASRGIGRAIAAAFHAAGAHVVGTRTGPADRDAAYPCHDIIEADFSNRDEIERCADRIGEIGPDILVNNAGINRIGTFAGIPLDDFMLIQQVNVAAPFRLCQAALPSMLAKQWGRIVNLSSIWGKIGKEFRASYSASKFALDGITLALAVEHAPNGILANCIAPGFTDTELTRSVLGQAGIDRLVGAVPARRLGTPDEVAQLVIWLASPLNTYVTGQNIAIDGGFARA